MLILKMAGMDAKKGRQPVRAEKDPGTDALLSPPEGKQPADILLVAQLHNYKSTTH